jgi:hypothetical protein
MKLDSLVNELAKIPIWKGARFELQTLDSYDGVRVVCIRDGVFGLVGIPGSLLRIWTAEMTPQSAHRVLYFMYRAFEEQERGR